MEAVEVSEASDISGLNELNRWKAAQAGLGVGGLVGPLVGVSISVCGGDTEAEHGRRTRDSGASSPGKWDAVASLRRGFLDACHLPRWPETGGNRIHGFFKIQKEGKLHPGNITPKCVEAGCLIANLSGDTAAR